MELALGTAQFGLAYGVAGRGTAVAESEVRAILECAASHGIGSLDTAPVYGDIEVRLARLAKDLPFGVVSKIPAIPLDLPVASAAGWVLEQAECSRARLGSLLTGLMFHRAADLSGDGGAAIWGAITGWAAAEKIAVGASFYEPEECVAMHRNRAIALAQIPGNAFDQRVARVIPAPISGLELYLRSAFLQGLLLLPESVAAIRLPAAAEPLRRWAVWCRRMHQSPLAAALSVARGFGAVSKIVVGVDSLMQLIEVIEAWELASSVVALELSCDDASVIDPRTWNIHNI